MLRKLSLVVLLALFAWAMVFLVRFNPENELKPGETLVSDKVHDSKSQNQFAFDLYEKLSEKEGNLFFSPYSVSSALTMVYAGAAGITEQEMAKVLHFNSANEKIHAELESDLKRLSSLSQQKSPKILIANRLWGQKGYKFWDSYTKLLNDHYGAAIEAVDFAGATEAARKAINQWTTDATNRKINDLIARYQLNPATRLVLTNAIYFEAAWALRFEKRMTQKMDFFISENQKFQVSMMIAQRYFKYGEFNLGSGIRLKALDIPYDKGEFSMVILLPSRPAALSSLEKKINANLLKGCLEGMKSLETVLFLPKFKIEQEFNLEEKLAALGMKSVFTPGIADLSKTDGTYDLCIGKVIHKTMIEIDERGTVAAGATAIMEPWSFDDDKEPPKPKQFICDHPFLFLIRDNHSGTILFLGRVANPNEK